jgi:hypothetical protein
MIQTLGELGKPSISYVVTHGDSYYYTILSSYFNWYTLPQLTNLHFLTFTECALDITACFLLLQRFTLVIVLFTLTKTD